MSAIHDLIADLQATHTIDPGKRDLLLQFLQAAAPTLQTLESAALEDLLQWLAGSATAPPPAVHVLDAPQVLALLSDTQREMDAAVEERLRQVAAARAAISNLADTALSVLAKLLLSVL